jgi:RNA polymerase sigma factor (sigma-70 family)
MTVQLVSSAADDGPDQPPSIVDEAFYAEYFPRLVRMLGQICPDRETAQDIAQETLVRVWERPELLDPSRPAWPWLRTVARRIAIDQMRGTARRSRILKERVRPQPVVDGSAEQVYMVAERDVLRRALTDVPDRQRAALALRHVLDWSPEQVADHLGVHKNAADQLLFRARRSLRLSYERACAALWVLWPGHWGRGSDNRGRMLDPRALEVGLSSAPVLERTLAVVMATVVAVGSAVAAGGMDVAEGAMQHSVVPTVIDDDALPVNLPPHAAPPAGSAGEEAQILPTVPVSVGSPEPPAPGERRTVVEVETSAVQQEPEGPADARTTAGADDEGLVVEREVRSHLAIGGGSDDAETEGDTESRTEGDGGMALACTGEIRGALCEAVHELP